MRTTFIPALLRLRRALLLLILVGGHSRRVWRVGLLSEPEVKKQERQGSTEALGQFHATPLCESW